MGGHVKRTKPGPAGKAPTAQSVDELRDAGIIGPRSHAALAALPPAQALTVAHYALPGSPTRGNAFRSYQAARPDASPPTASTAGPASLRSHQAREAVATILEESLAGRKVRGRVLADVLSGTQVEVTETEHLDEEGRVIGRTRSRRNVTARDRLRAVDLANKMDGLYQEQRVAGQAALETYYRDLDAETERILGRVQRKPTHRGSSRKPVRAVTTDAVASSSAAEPAGQDAMCDISNAEALSEEGREGLSGTPAAIKE